MYTTKEVPKLADDSAKRPSEDLNDVVDCPNQIVVHLMLGYRKICIIVAGIPFVTMLVCFVSAYVFQSEEIHETHCRVYNVIPSISAITGISPQRYLWRICIALHIGPRFIIATVYRNYYLSLLKNLNRQHNVNKIKKFIALVYWLHLTEISALSGVTYISNRENYPIHEKIFIVFMVSSLLHMLATIKLIEMLQPNGDSGTGMSPLPAYNQFSLKCKKQLFALSIASTIGLIIFFLKHRFLCHDMAFSWFALCEYILAFANMAFHCTTILDFPSEQVLIARGGDFIKRQQQQGPQQQQHQIYSLNRTNGSKID